MTKTPIEKACECVGSQAAMAALIGVTPQAIYKWHLSGKVPAERVLAVEQATGGVVSRCDLRPDLYPPDERDRRTADAQMADAGKPTITENEADDKSTTDREVA